MPLWLDEHVPNSVQTFLIERGHQVNRVRDFFQAGTPDSALAVAANDQRAVIVTEDKDFRQLIERRRRNRGPFYPRMGLIHFGCEAVIQAERLGKFIELIELEYQLAQARRDTRFCVQVNANLFVVRG